MVRGRVTAGYFEFCILHSSFNLPESGSKAIVFLQPPLPRVGDEIPQMGRRILSHTALTFQGRHSLDSWSDGVVE